MSTTRLTAGCPGAPCLAQDDGRQRGAAGLPQPVRRPRPPPHPYRVNNYARLRRHPGEIACVVGEAPVLRKIPCGTPVVFGPAGYDHPIDDPTLLSDHNIRGVLVSCEWVRKMCEPYWGRKVHAWAEGFDTEGWSPPPRPRGTSTSWSATGSAATRNAIARRSAIQSSANSKPVAFAWLSSVAAIRVSAPSSAGHVRWCC